MKASLQSTAKDVYEIPRVDVITINMGSIILGSDGSTQNYTNSDPWDTEDNE